MQLNTDDFGKRSLMSEDSSQKAISIYFRCTRRKSTDKKSFSMHSEVTGTVTVEDYTQI